MEWEAAVVLMAPRILLLHLETRVHRRVWAVAVEAETTRYCATTTILTVEHSSRMMMVEEGGKNRCVAERIAMVPRIYPGHHLHYSSCLLLLPWIDSVNPVVEDLVEAVPDLQKIIHSNSTTILLPWMGYCRRSQYYYYRH
jgi:hypothetical protein